jgi:hypothetical protein
MGMTIDEYMAELNRKKEAPAEPQKPAETGDFWTDMRNRWEHLNAQEQYNQQIADSAQNPFAQDMKIAEFRPANRREKSFTRALKKLAESPEAEREKIRKNILKKYGSDDYTPQVDSDLSGHELGMLYNDPKKTAGIRSDVKRIIQKDIQSLGYEPGTQFVKQSKWSDINAAEIKKKPKHMYHVTDEKNIQEIAKTGLTTPKSRGVLPNVEQYVEQADRVFLTDNPKSTTTWQRSMEEIGYPETMSREMFEEFSGSPATHRGQRFEVDGIEMAVKDLRDDLVTIQQRPVANLRTKTPKGIRADYYQEERPHTGESWYQQKDPIPPQALEIETAPGQWEALLDYIRKGGK